MNRRQFILSALASAALGFPAIAQAKPDTGWGKGGKPKGTTTTATTTTTVPTTTTTETTVANPTTPTWTTPPSTMPAGSLNVLDYGATGNGTTDDRAAIASGVAAAISAGKTLYFPAGTYKVVFDADNHEFAYDAGDLSVAGAGHASTILDCYPKTIGAYGYHVFHNQTVNRQLTLQGLTIAGPTGTSNATYIDPADHFWEADAVYSVVPANRNNPSNTVIADDVFITGVGWANGIFTSNGGGGVYLTNCYIHAQICGVTAYDNDDTNRLQREVIISDSEFDDCDGENIGVCVYVHRRVDMRLTDCLFTNNHRTAVQHFGGEAGVPNFTEYTNCTFVDCSEANIWTTMRACTAIITGYSANNGRIVTCYSATITNSTFTGADTCVQIPVEGYTNGYAYMDLVVSDSTFSCQEADAIRGDHLIRSSTLTNVTYNYGG